MSFVNQSIIKHKLGLLNLAEELGNVSQACRVMGVSRDTFYRVKEGTILNEFYQAAFRKKIYTTLEELQNDLDVWIAHYNNERIHQGKMCCGRTPMATFEEGKIISRERSIA